MDRMMYQSKWINSIAIVLLGLIAAMAVLMVAAGMDMLLNPKYNRAECQKHVGGTYDARSGECTIIIPLTKTRGLV